MSYFGKPRDGMLPYIQSMEAQLPEVLVRMSQGLGFRV